MKSIFQNLYRSLFLAAALLALSTAPAMAQDEFPEDVNDEPPVPINGFVLCGIAAGAVLGIRKLKKAES